MTSENITPEPKKTPAKKAPARKPRAKKVAAGSWEYDPVSNEARFVSREVSAEGK